MSNTWHQWATRSWGHGSSELQNSGSISPGDVVTGSKGRGVGGVEGKGRGRGNQGLYSHKSSCLRPLAPPSLVLLLPSLLVPLNLLLALPPLTHAGPRAPWFRSSSEDVVTDTPVLHDRSCFNHCLPSSPPSTQKKRLETRVITAQCRF